MHFLLKIRRPLLFVAAIGNILGSLIALISPAFFFNQLFKNPPDPASTFPYLGMYHYSWWGFVLIMGIAYWMCAVNFDKHRIVTMIGGLGKLVAAAFWVMLFSQGHGAWLMISGGVWDGLLGIILLIYFFGKQPQPTVGN